MAIVKLNNYIPNKDVEDMIDNVDIDRLGRDDTMITVNYTASPATFTILQGSIIEHNGDTYEVTTDTAVVMSNASHNYITFNGTAFTSAATIGTFDIDKQGYYSTTLRTLKYYIDQANESEFVLMDILYPDLTLFSKKLDRIKVGLSANQSFGSPSVLLNLDTVYTDNLGSWDSVNYNFTAQESGYFYLCVHGKPTFIGATVGVLYEIRKNGSEILTLALTTKSGTAYQSAMSSSGVFYLSVGDVIELWGLGDPSLSAVAGEEATYLIVARFL